MKLIKSFRFGILVILLLSFILIISVRKFYPTQGVEQGASWAEFTAYLERRVPVLMKHYDIPGACIALIQDAEIVWSGAYGYADLETGRKMTVETICRVESISKPVTAWGVMKLVEQGKIELDVSVEEYLGDWELPESEFSEAKVTVRRLLSHSAGMPLGNVFERYDPTEKIPSLEETLSGEAILTQEPGVAFSYSNTGFNILELLIEKVTGRDFAEYMKTEVLLPLGMRQSGFDWKADWEPLLPNGYDLKGNPVSVYVYPTKASGGLFANVEDIGIFVAAGMSGFTDADRRILSPESINRLYTPIVEKLGLYSLAFDAYGLGHFLENLDGGKRGVSHGGQGYGWMSHFHFVPESGVGIVILTNSQRSWPFFAYLLNDWAQWNGFTSVGMGRIILGQKILWTLIGLILFISLRQGYRLGRVLISGGRRFAPGAKRHWTPRLAQSSLAVIILAGLWWAVNQDYLFIASVFPIASGWLGCSILISAVVLLLSGLFPSVNSRLSKV